MSTSVLEPVGSLVAAAEQDIAALTKRRFVNEFEASLISERHVSEVLAALRGGALHGSQRDTGGLWKVRPACLTAWAAEYPCEHQERQGRLPLAELRFRTVGGVR